MKAWSVSSTACFGGAALVALSAFLPWVRTADGANSGSIAPAGESLLRPALVLLFGLLAAGVLIMYRRRDPALLGCVGALWLGTTLFVWLAGARIASVIPANVVPDHVALQLGIGATVGLIGGLVLLVGVVLELSNQAWSYQPPALRVTVLAPGLLIAVACIAVRGLGWLRLTAGSFRWSLDFDVVPVLGDAMTIALVLGSVVCLVVILRPSRTATGILATLGISISALSIVAYLVKSVADNYGRSLIRRLPVVGDANEKVILSMTAGPICSLLIGLAIIGYSAVQWKVVSPQSQRRDVPGPISPSASIPGLVSPADELPF